MNDIKMSDVFVLPVSSNKGDLFNSKNPISDTRVCKFYNMNQFQASKAAELAINSYDTLMKDNATLRSENSRLITKCNNSAKIERDKYLQKVDKLTEQNKLLREALEEILYNHRLASFDIESVATKALEATKC